MITSSNAHGVDTLSTEFGESGLTTELEFSFLAVMSALTTRGASFMARGSGNAHDLDLKKQDAPQNEFRGALKNH